MYSSNSFRLFIHSCSNYLLLKKRNKGWLPQKGYWMPTMQPQLQSPNRQERFDLQVYPTASKKKEIRENHVYLQCKMKRCNWYITKYSAPLKDLQTGRWIPPPSVNANIPKYHFDWCDTHCMIEHRLHLRWVSRSCYLKFLIQQKISLWCMW